MSLNLLIPVFDKNGNENNECNAAYLNLNYFDAEQIFHIYVDLFKNNKGSFEYEYSCEEFLPNFFNYRTINFDTFYGFSCAFDHLFYPPGVSVVESEIVLNKEDITSVESCKLFLCNNGFYWTAYSTENKTFLKTDQIYTDYLESVGELYFEDYL